MVRSALEALAPLAGTRPTDSPPDPPLPLASGNKELQRVLAPRIALFLERPLAALTAKNHAGPIRWTLFAADSAELAALAGLPRKGEDVAVIAGNVTPSEEARVRHFALTQLNGCGVAVAREARGHAARVAAAATGRNAPDWGEPLFSAADVVVPPGADSAPKVQAVVDAEGLDSEQVFAAFPEPEAGGGDGIKREETAEDAAVVQARAAEEERAWRMKVHRQGKLVRAARKAASPGTGEEAGVAATGEPVGVEAATGAGAKSDFFLQLLAKNV